VSCAIKLLAYCVAHGASRLPATGVRGAPVHAMNVDALWCAYSPLVPPQEFSREDALSFHSVLRAAFEQQAIIPFRFPTILQNESELQVHLRDKHLPYLADLERLKDAVQMELRIAGKPEVASAATGKEYLRSKQLRSHALQAESEKARTALGGLVLEWKERAADQGLRCYALIKRDGVASFRKILETAFSSPSAVLLSGPWPATEFLHD